MDRSSYEQERGKHYLFGSTWTGKHRSVKYPGHTKKKCCIMINKQNGISYVLTPLQMCVDIQSSLNPIAYLQWAATYKYNTYFLCIACPELKKDCAGPIFSSIEQC